jgi:hypothetical protein
MSRAWRASVVAAVVCIIGAMTVNGPASADDPGGSTDTTAPPTETTAPTETTEPPTTTTEPPTTTAPTTTTTAAPTAPGAPRNLSPVVGNGIVSITWDAPASDGGSPITGYRVALTGGASASRGVSASTRSATFDVAAGLSVRLTVTAVNAVGDGPVATSGPVTTAALPAAPVFDAATPGDGEVAFVLSSVPTASSYQVELQPSGRVVTVSRIDELEGLTNGQTVTLRARAVNGLGSGAWSAAISLTPRTTPSAPAITTVTPGDGELSVAFAVPSSNGGAAITGYEVRVGTRAVTGATSPIVVDGLTNGQATTVSVVAINVAGRGAASAPAIGVPRRPPFAVEDAGLSVGVGSITVTWSPPLDDGGAPITGHELIVTPSPGSIALGADARSATVDGLDPDVAYTVVLRALNAAGVGDSVAAADVRPDRAAVIEATPLPTGYWILADDGLVVAFGDVTVDGDARGRLTAGSSAVSVRSTASGRGLWIVDAAGGVVVVGDATSFGSLPAGFLRSGERVSAIAPTRTGQGYWLFTTLGRVATFGDAVDHGSMDGTRLNGPVLDAAVTASGNGYSMVASDGGIFAFGDAEFLGSMGGRPLNAPVRSLVPDPDGRGYWLVAGDGGVFAFEATFRGSMGGQPLNRPVTGMVPYGDGYLMVASDGGVFVFSDRPFAGSLGGTPPARPVVAVTAIS